MENLQNIQQMSHSWILSWIWRVWLFKMHIAHVYSMIAINVSDVIECETFTPKNIYSLLYNCFVIKILACSNKWPLVLRIFPVFAVHIYTTSIHIYAVTWTGNRWPGTGLGHCRDWGCFQIYWHENINRNRNKQWTGQRLELHMLVKQMFAKISQSWRRS